MSVNQYSTHRHVFVFMFTSHDEIQNNTPATPGRQSLSTILHQRLQCFLWPIITLQTVIRPWTIPNFLATITIQILCKSESLADIQHSNNSISRHRIKFSMNQTTIMTLPTIPKYRINRPTLGTKRMWKAVVVIAVSKPLLLRPCHPGVSTMLLIILLHRTRLLKRIKLRLFWWPSATQFQRSK